MTRALVIDTETTGLITNRTVRRAVWPEIIEFAGTLLDWETGEILDEYSTLVRPWKSLDPKTTEITGLTDADLANERSFAEVAAQIKAAIERSDLVIAHNASFDAEILDMEFERLGQKLSWPRLLCTVEQTISLKGFRMNLGLLHEHLFGMAHADAHRAGVDVRALVRVVKELRRTEVI